MAAADRRVQWMVALGSSLVAVGVVLMVWEQAPPWSFPAGVAVTALGAACFVASFAIAFLTKDGGGAIRVESDIRDSPGSSAPAVGTVGRDFNYYFNSASAARSAGAPRLALHDERNAFHVKLVPWGFGMTSVLGLRLINAPESHEESAVAKGVRAKFTCEGPGIVLPWIDARFDYSPQPSELAQGQLPTLAYDFGIDEWREINLILKEPDADNCYLFNNDSYRYPRVQKPQWAIPPGEYKTIVRVSGVGVREQFECIFTNPGKGGDLQVDRFWQADGKTTAQTTRADLESLPPRPIVSLENGGERSYLRVRNEGSAAEFWATLEVSGTVDMPKEDIFARWAHAHSIRALIPKGGSHRLYLARSEIRHPVPAGIRFIQYATEDRVCEGRGNGWIHGDAYKSTAPGTRIILTVTLFSDPPPVGEPARKIVRFEGTKAEMR